MKTFASLFTGFGGVDIGAKAAGMELAWGIEYDAAIAEVGNANLGNHIKVANIRDCLPRYFARVDVLHASPPCPNFSVAKANGIETAHDIALATKVAEFVTTLQPQVFTLENVIAYRQSQSWRTIEDALFGAGYWVNVEIVNAADYGVPQTRRRMIVRAVRGGFVPYLPQPEPWVGWYAAIEDIIDTLPESKFAAWQLARLPEELRQHVLFANNGGNDSYGDHHVMADEPSGAITGQSLGRAKAFLVGKTADKFGDGIRYGREPAQTIGANEHGSKGFTHHGKVVAMTPRALARFQSFPDWYELPEKRTLAARGIGNAVPPLMMEKIYSSLLEVMRCE